MTSADLIQIARDMQAEYYGQATRETAPTHQFALNEKGNAMAEFILRVEHLQSGAHEHHEPKR